MSKAQKGNKEKKKPKADKNQPKTHVSAYKAAQGQGKGPSTRSREKPEARFGCKGRMRGSPRTRLALTSSGARSQVSMSAISRLAVRFGSCVTNTVRVQRCTTA
jgi:hypothetical protein